MLGYSPERINPGDRQHRVERILKVVAGSTPEVTERLAELYRRVTAAGVHRAPDIRTAEAAKVIENAQRDINIAFINEVAMICGDLGRPARRRGPRRSMASISSPTSPTAASTA